MPVTAIAGTMLRKVFGSRNDRLLKRYNRQVQRINALEPQMRGDYDRKFAEESVKLPPIGEGTGQLTSVQYTEAVQALRVNLSADLRERTEAARRRFAQGHAVEDVLPEAFAILREASRRAQNHRHFDCQLVGGQVLFEGKIAEMKTGEGKTIVCHLAAFLKILQGKKVYIVTVNDYLVQRDADFAKPIFALVGMTVGYIQSQVDPGGREGIRAAAYACNITYGTNNEFGFDYLRDNMKTSLAEQVQGRLDFAIIDEVDSILIDEARTPLIISGPADDDVNRYRTADAVARVLISKQSASNNETTRRLNEWGDKPPKERADLPKFADGVRKFRSDPNWITEDEAEAIGHQQCYVVRREGKHVAVTHDGITVAQEQLGVGSLYVGANMEWPHLIENSVKAHVVYEKDVDYVVKDGEIIIVDPFTGRLMHGRQWSDGLHQAVEAKERVKVKEESQTLATITLQNYFKLFERISGMTGTAMTEADEFMKIYKLDVVSIPTNRPVNRQDHHDRIYKNVDDKYTAIVEEIHDVHTKGRPNDPLVLEPVLKALRGVLLKQGRSTTLIDDAIAEWKGGNGSGEKMAEAYDDAMGDLARGRPVLVGTISIENSERLSNLLTRKYGIEHEVLNAKQHAREAEIVKKAGQRHVAARGKSKEPLGNVTIATNMAGRGTDIKLEAGVVHPGCVGDLGPPSDSNGRLFGWKESGVIGTKCCIQCPDYDPKTNCAHCWKPKVDPRFPEMGRKVCSLNVPCGLHIIGTERHESRRIDNQLRGRSGRQGDPGSSRFFLSLGDDLLKMFMGEWTLKMLERMGFQDGMAIEARSINKGIERAQKKVEERNFSIRKHLLEYDEVMDHQRQVFYSQRQEILHAAKPGHSKPLVARIWRMLDATIESAAKKYLAPDFAGQCVCEWARAGLDVTLEPKRIDVYSQAATEQYIRSEAREEANNQISMTVGEYLDPDLDPKQWDIRGLARWAETRFGSTITQNHLQRMSPDEIRETLSRAAEQKIEEQDLSAIERFLDPHLGKKSLIAWAHEKFGVELPVEKFLEMEQRDAVACLRDAVRDAYREREIRYPVEWILERTVLREGVDLETAAEHAVTWVNFKFGVKWTAAHIKDVGVEQFAAELYELNKQYFAGAKLEEQIDAALSSGQDPAEWARQRYGPIFDESEVDVSVNPREALLTFGRDILRHELTSLERFVLLQLYDQAWKEHMHAIDLLKEAIGLRAFAEKDPRIAYKVEGFQMFEEMMTGIQDKVTGIIFKARLADESQARSRYNIGAVRHAESTNLGFSGQVDKDRDAAMQAQGQEAKVETIRREQPRVGRNEPCPCGSGKKYKQCHGKTK